MIPANARKIFRETREQFGGNEIRTLFGAEYKMNEDVREFVSHALNMHIFCARVCDE